VTNLEFAAVLEKLAEHYRSNAELERINLSKWFYDKEGLAAMLRDLRGRWKKEVSGDTISFTSDSLQGLSIYIPRDKVCRRTVTYDCDPIMSPEEESEILQEAV
jgi:hypothetical protein